MLTTTDFFIAGKWTGIATIVMAALTILAFVFKWGVRFRFVGITSFMAVLVAGLFALSIVPFTRAQIPGAGRYATVYDNGATQVVIAVSPTITQTQLEATLKQAASDLSSPGRLGRGENQILIRARTIIHPEPGMSQLVYLGAAKRSLINPSAADMADAGLTLEINAKEFAKLPQASS